VTGFAQASEWMERAWGDRSGFFVSAYGVGGHYDEYGKYTHKRWHERPGRWPDDYERLLDEVIGRAETDDVYVAPYLRSVPSRKKGSALPSDLLYADLDVVDASLNGFEALLVGPGGLVVNSGQGLHVYLGLPDALEPAELERLNRQLAHRLGADAGWSENKVLRLPGTWNHKGRARGGESLPVQIVNGRRADRDWTPDVLVQLLGPAPEVDSPAARVAPEMPESVPAHLRARLQEAPAGDRSKQTYGFVGACLEAGLSDAATLALALEHEPTRAKYGDRAAAEIERAIAKHRAGGTSPRPQGEDGPQPLRTVRGDAIEMRSIEWLDKPQLQGSAFHLAAGPKGVGKGTWLARKIADTTHGRLGPKRNVLIVSSEDSASIDLKPRLVAAGADHTRWHLVTEQLMLPRDLYRLEDLANAIGDVGLIVLDPVGNHLGGVDTDKEGLVRFAISGLNRLADDLACMIVGVRHLAKLRVHGALAAVLGSTAWVDVPRAVLAFARDDIDEMVFYVQVVAGNRSGRTAAHGYRIELRDVGLKEPVTSAVPIGESSKNVDDLLAAPRRGSKSDGARELILDILETDGEQESDALDARVSAETGLTARTIRNLRGELGKAGLIKSIPESDEVFGVVARWKVARTAAPRPGSEAGT
jgi:hypothetical protein